MNYFGINLLNEGIPQASNQDFYNYIMTANGYTPLNQPSIYDAMKTQLPVGQEIGYQVAKYNSPFANDSGYDYDLRGAYQRLGGLNPEATNGHLSDYDKLPIHPTFSIDSKFYNGQSYAINPEIYSYPEEQKIGTPTGGAAPITQENINEAYMKTVKNKNLATNGRRLRDIYNQKILRDYGEVSGNGRFDEGLVRNIIQSGMLGDYTKW